MRNINHKSREHERKCKKYHIKHVHFTLSYLQSIQIQLNPRMCLHAYLRVAKQKCHYAEYYSTSYKSVGLRLLSKQTLFK